MLTSQRVRPGRVRPAIFPYHFTYSSPSGLKRLRALPLDQALVVAIEALPLIKLLLQRSRHFPSIKLPPPVSRTGIDLEVVFLIGLQSTPARSPHQVLRQWTMRAVVMRRCNKTDERLGCSHDADAGINDDLMSR